MKKNIDEIDFLKITEDDYKQLHSYILESYQFSEEDEASDEEAMKQLKKSDASDEFKKGIEEEAKKDPKKAGKMAKVGLFLLNMLNSASNSSIASLLDNFTLGNMKEAICEIYQKQKLDKMSPDDVDKVGKELHETPEYKKAKKQNIDTATRKDDNTNAEIDESTIQCGCLWYSPKKDQNMLKILNQLVIDIQKQAKNQEKQIADLKSKVKSMKIKNVGDEEVDAFGPIIANMVKDNKSPEEISKKVASLKAGVKEAFERKCISKMIVESKNCLTESQKNMLLVETICETDEYIDNLARCLIEEGFLDKIKGAAGKMLSKIPEKFKSKIKDTTDKALTALKNGGLTPILKIGGIAAMALSGAWGIGLIIATMMLIERHGKQLKYAFDYMYNSFANSKGVISQFDFKTKGNDAKYSARYFVTDQTWRVVNTSNQNKHPNKDFAKAVLTSDFGKKYIDRVIELWDPVFSEEKGGKIDFAELLKQSKDLKISDKQIQLLNDFREQYKEIKTNYTKPQIDTRAQKL